MTFATNPDRSPATSARIARRLVAPVILSAAIASLVLAVPPLRGVAGEIAHLHPVWVLAAIAFEIGSCLGFVVIFRLFFDEVPAGAARELALTEQGSGRCCPAAASARWRSAAGCCAAPGCRRAASSTARARCSS